MTLRTRVITKRRRPRKNRLWNAACRAGDLVAAGGQRGHRAGQRLARAERVEGEQRARGRAGGEGDDHRLADGPRDGQDHRRDDAGDRRRDDDAEGRPELARAEAVRRLAESDAGPPASRPRRSTRRAGWSGSRRRCPAASRLKPLASVKIAWTTFGLIQRQGEEAEDDARDAGEDLQDRLDDAADPLARVLGQVDRAGEADGRGEQRSRRS